MKKNALLRFRNLIENRCNNWVKSKTNQDLFDWSLLGLWALVSLGIAITYRVFADSEVFNLNDLLSFEVFWFTAFVITRYTKETFYLKKLAQEQNITNIRPYLRLQWQTDSILVLVNEGQGVAVALKPEYRANEQVTKLLEITAMAAAPNSSTTSFIPKGFDMPNPETHSYEIKIRYQDIESRRYVARFKTNVNFNDKFQIITQREG